MIKVFSGFSPKKVLIADTFDCVVLAGCRAWDTLALMGVGGGCGCRRRRGGEDEDKRPSNWVNFWGGGNPLHFWGHVYGRNGEMFFAGLALARAAMSNPVSGDCTTWSH